MENVYRVFGASSSSSLFYFQKHFMTITEFTWSCMRLGRQAAVVAAATATAYFQFVTQFCICKPNRFVLSSKLCVSSVLMPYEK